MKFLRSSFTTLFVRVSGVGGHFLLTLLITRSLGAERAGRFFVAYAVLQGVAMVTRFGLDHALTKFIGAQPEKTHCRGFILQGLVIHGLLSLAVLIVMYIPIGVFWPWFVEKNYGFVTVFALAGVLWGTSFVFSGILKGLSKPQLAAMVENGILALGAVVIYGIYVALSGSPTLMGLTVIFVTVLFAINWATFLGLCRQGYVNAEKYPTRAELKNLFIYATPIFVSTSLAYIITWVPIIFLGIFAPSQDAAVFNVLQRIALLIAFILIVVNSITAPKYARFYQEKNLRAISQLTNATTRVMSAIALVAFLLLFVWGGQFLALFGTAFPAYKTYLLILALGQLVNVGTGSVTYILLMTESQDIVQKVSIISVLLTVCVGDVLIYFFQVYGAVIITAFSMMVQNLMLWFYLNYVKGIQSSLFGIEWKKVKYVA